MSNNIKFIEKQNGITEDDCIKFSKLSGDFNPIHLDSNYAYKSMFGEQIVYGSLQILKCLNLFAKQVKKSIFIKKLKVLFKTALYLNKQYLIRGEFDDNKAIIQLYQNEVLVCKIALDYESNKVSDKPYNTDIYIKDVPNQQESNQLIVDNLDFNYAACKDIFPETFIFINKSCIGSILMSTRVIGMKCPGLNSIFNSLELTFTQQSQDNSTTCFCDCSINQFNSCTIKINSKHCFGILRAFVRPKPIIQNSIRLLKKNNYILNNLKNKKVLVIGGSNGIGSQCCKILSLSGAQVLFTYYRDKDAAKKLKDEIDSECQQKINYHQFDILNYSVDTINKLKLFSAEVLIYFATPKINDKHSKQLSANIFKEFTNCYIFQFDKLINEIGIRNLKVIFSPSSSAIEDLPQNMLEYALAKSAFETYMRILSKFGIKVLCPRFPRVHTSLSQSILNIKDILPEDILYKYLSEI